jgi:hypothetical protein
MARAIVNRQLLASDAFDSFRAPARGVSHDRFAGKITENCAKITKQSRQIIETKGVMF